MQCEAFEYRLQSLLDRRQRPEVDDQLRAHALGCDACRQTLDAQESLFAGLAAFEFATAEPPAAQAIAAHALAEMNPPAGDRKTASRWTSLRWAAPLIAAAAVVALLLAPFWFGSSDAQPKADQVAENPISTPETDETNTPVAPQLPQVDLTQFTFASSLPDQLPTVDTLARLDAPVLSKGLRPLTSSFNSALTVIRRTIPGGRSDAASESPQAFAIKDLDARV